MKKKTGCGCNTFKYGGKVKKYDFGGVVSELGNLASSASVLTGPAAPFVAVGGEFLSMIGGIASAAKEKKEAEALQKKEEMIKTQNLLLSAPMAKAGIWNNPLRANMKKYGGYANGIVPTTHPTKLQETKKPMFNDKYDFQYFNSGGTHEQHPMGGIPIGMSPDGKMNTVQEGELAITDTDGKKFIVSNDIPFGKYPGIPGFIKGRTFAEAFKSLDRTFKEKKDLPSLMTKNDYKDKLIRFHEEEKARMVQAQQKKSKGVNQFVYGGHPLDRELTTEEILAEDSLNPLKRYDSAADKAMNEYMKKDPDKPKFFSEDWFKQNESKIDTGLSIAGYGTQTAGLISSIIQRRQLKQSKNIGYSTQDPNIFKENLVNRQQVIRGIEGSQGTALQALKNSSSGDFGQYASNVAAVQAGTGKAIGDAMLQANQLDTAEIARVQQGKAGIMELNNRNRFLADTTNLENEAAYNAQRTAYGNAITQNIGNLGQSMVNYVIAKKFSKEKEKSGIAQAMTNK
jgi:hypothetical protein